MQPESILSTAVAEAAKTVAVSLAGSAAASAGQLVRLLLRKIPVLPSDPARLAEAIMRQAQRDPQFAAELYDSLAAAIAGGDVVVAPFPPDPFRDRDLARDAMARASGVWAVVGQLGAGKTAFVRRVAHDVAPRFPGGQVNVDLDEWRDGNVVRIAEVKAYVLRQLGVDVVEAAEPAVSQQYLSALLRRRFVLIIESAVGVEEVRTLAQPWPCSLVLVTTGKLTDEMRMWFPADQVVVLHGLDDAGAWRLLADACGEQVLAVEPEATRRLLALCDRMPFAIKQLGVVLSRRAGEPGVVAAVLEEFREIAGDEGVIRECLDRTFAGLALATVDGVLALVGHPGESFTYRSAGAMLGRSARRTVDELTDAGLLEQERGRLRLPQLVRQHAHHLAERRRLDDGPPFDRLLAYYRDMALAADARTGDRLRPHPVPEGLAWPASGVDPVGWLDAESGVIVELVKQASLRGRHLEAVQLCAAMEVLLNSHYGHEWRCAEAFDWGVRSADALGDAAVRVRRYTMCGRVFTLLHVFDRAAAALDVASRLFADLDYPRLETSVLESHGRLHEEMTEYQAALGRIAAPDYTAAAQYLRRAVAIDEQALLARPLRLHRRMLANILVKAGDPAEAVTLLNQTPAQSGEARNDARDHMVLAKAYTALGDLTRARTELAAARALLRQAQASRYELELADITADIAVRDGDFEAARAAWGWVADRYCGWGHPKLSVYLAKLDQLPPPPR